MVVDDARKAQTFVWGGDGQVGAPWARMRAVRTSRTLDTVSVEDGDDGFGMMGAGGVCGQGRASGMHGARPRTARSVVKTARGLVGLCCVALMMRGAGMEGKPHKRCL